MTTHYKTLLATLLLSASPLIAQAQGDVQVDNAWVRATVPQQKATGAFMVLTAPQGGKLVKATSTLTPTVEIHEMAMDDNNVMKMRQVQAIDLPAGQPVELKPGGYHVMLFDLPQQVKEGDQIPLTLVIERQDGSQASVEVTAPAKPLTGGGQGHGGGHGKGGHKH